MNSYDPWLRYSRLSVLALMLASAWSAPVLAFDPTADADIPVANGDALPSTRVLTEPVTSRAVVTTPSVMNVLRAKDKTSFTPITFDPTAVPPLQSASAAGGVPPIDTAPASVTPLPVESPVKTTSFIAPPPLLAPVAPLPTAPVIMHALPVVVAAPVIVSAPRVTPAAADLSHGMASATPPLSTDTKKILSTVPSKLDTPLPGKGGKVTLSRVSPKVDDMEKKKAVDAYESAGIKISVSHPGVDTNAELTEAYTALSRGEMERAIDHYKRVLAAEPLNQDALFSLASIYHREGQIDKARPLYGILLKNYPDNRDGLNNFLVLVSEESPQEALAELSRLEERNPDFSPIPAQEGLLLNKLGYAAQAREKMLRAIDLAPGNATYKYNLAVMADGQGDYATAAALYRALLHANMDGTALPIATEDLQKRLDFIATQTTASQGGAN